MFSESYQWLTSPVCVTAVLIAIVLAAAWIKSFFKKQYNATHKSICIILGSGGHTMEMMEILKDIDCQHFSPRHYIIASTDQTSEGKVILHEQQIQSQTDLYYFQDFSKSSSQPAMDFQYLFNSLGSMVFVDDILSLIPRSDSMQWSRYLCSNRMHCKIDSTFGNQQGTSHVC
ncbi:UDP-N-acetylglucosamine transferase subunit, variant 2 [Batrachochytrium dendrobatidis]|nr:UDP-N-acetylglucosamine transferase subunit, variant 2 [Batrachochytrium dendrobatidis]